MPVACARLLAAARCLVLVLASTPEALGSARAEPPRGSTGPRRPLQQRAHATPRSSGSTSSSRGRPGRPAPQRRLSALELDIVARINAQRGARGLRPLRVSRGLTAAASHHTRQMGQLGFFEHESVNGAPFWRRIERFYPAGRGYWSVGENIFWESPDTSAASAVREWMTSPPHRRTSSRASGGNRHLGRALRLGSGRVRRPVGHDRDRRFRRPALRPRG